MSKHGQNHNEQCKCEKDGFLGAVDSHDCPIHNEQTHHSEVEGLVEAWTNEFTSENSFGERQLDQFCVTEYTRNTPIITDESPIVKKHKEWLRNALTTHGAKEYERGFNAGIEVAEEQHTGRALLQTDVTKVENVPPCTCGNRGYTALVNNEHLERCPNYRTDVNKN